MKGRIEMLDIAIYFIIIIGFAFMVYQTHKSIVQIKRASMKENKNKIYSYYAVLIVIWALYIFAVLYTLIFK